MMCPFPAHGLRHTTRLRSPVRPVSLELEDQASLEASSPESCGRHYRSFRAGSQTSQNRLLACATDALSLILFHAGIERRKNLANDSLLPVMLLTPRSLLWHNSVCLSCTPGRKCCEAVAVTSTTKGRDYAGSSRHNHARQTRQGYGTCPGHGRPLPHRAAGAWLPAIRSLSECPRPRYAGPPGAV